MLAKRIIPCLDIHQGRVVKGIQFKELKDAGSPKELGAYYYEQGADELIFLDITASVEKRNIIIQTVKETAQQVFIPLTVGGGIRSLQDMRGLLLAGADKVAINTAALEDPTLIKKGASMFGGQCMVVAIDVKRKEGPLPSWEVYKYGGRTPTGLDLKEWMKRAQDLGAGEFLLTSMDADGTRKGYDEDLYRTASLLSEVPVIASGGAGSREDFFQVLQAGAHAVLAASLFHYGLDTIKGLKEYLHQRGLPIRMEWEG